MIEVNWGASSHVGLRRSVNEDSLLCRPPVFLVADGMGGYAAGDVASAIVIDEFSTAVGHDTVTADWVAERLDHANARVIDGIGGGTTVTGAAVTEQEGAPYWLVFNVGDSRVYHCLNGEVTQVTVDHSVVQELVDAGRMSAPEARVHPERNVITRALGSPEALTPDFWLLPVRQGDRLVLCSDGLPTEVPPERLADLIGDPTEAQHTADTLVAAALAGGGRDNVTVVVVDVLSLGAATTGSDLATDGCTTPRVELTAHDLVEATSPRVIGVSIEGGH